jgi:hypothetical protein
MQSMISKIMIRSLPIDDFNENFMNLNYGGGMLQSNGKLSNMSETKK